MMIYLQDLAREQSWVLLAVRPSSLCSDSTSSISSPEMALVLGECLVSRKPSALGSVVL